MNSQQKAAEIIRLTNIFAQGCGNTALIEPKRPPSDCEICSRDFVARINKVLEGEAPIDGKLLHTGWVEEQP